MSATRKPAPSDRFSSREETEWNQGAFDDGAKARMVYGAPITDAPSPEVIGNWCHKSWRAGWADADASLAESGAPLQPGATQPEHDGGQMKEKVLCELCGEPMPKGEEMFNYHGQSGPCPKPPLPKAIPEKLFTHSELTALLERMARLVVQEVAKLKCEYCARGEDVGDDGWHFAHLCEALDIRKILRPAWLKPIREAVERG